MTFSGSRVEFGFMLGTDEGGTPVVGMSGTRFSPSPVGEVEEALTEHEVQALAARAMKLSNGTNGHPLAAAIANALEMHHLHLHKAEPAASPIAVAYASDLQRLSG